MEDISKFINLQSQISNLRSLLNKLTPSAVLYTGQISSTEQPNNGIIYEIPYYISTITMPLSASYKNYGFKMTFLPISGDVSLNLASENSNDIIIFNGESYSSGYFIISWFYRINFNSTRMVSNLIFWSFI